MRGADSIQYLRGLGVFPGRGRRTIISRLYKHHVGGYDSGKWIQKQASCDPRTKLLATVNGIKVFQVDGEAVRLHHFADFVQGGNHEVYPWVPEGEVWVEDGLSRSKVLLTTLHELVEVAWMKRGRTYPTAHTYALSVERYCRQHPSAIPTLLTAAAHGVLLSMPGERKVIEQQNDRVHNEG
jgi:hypothetical protein